MFGGIFEMLFGLPGILLMGIAFPLDQIVEPAIDDPVIQNLLDFVIGLVRCFVHDHLEKMSTEVREKENY